MIVYWDLLILSTIIVNYAFIRTIAMLLNDRLKVYRVILALIVSVLMLLLYFLPYKTYFAIRYIMGVLVGLIAFSNKSIKIKIIEIVLFYLLTMTFIGTLFVFKIKSIILMIISLIYVICLYIIQGYAKHFKNIYSLRIENKKINGLYDTGNNTNYLNVPIVYLSQSLYNELFLYVTDIEISTVNNISKISIYQGPKIVIDKKSLNVYYAFCNIDTKEYQAILPNNIFDSSHNITK